MVILVLVVLWIVVLAPTLVKRWLDQRSTGSIDSFHEQLHLLERTGPKLVAPAYRLETAESCTGVTPGSSGFPSVSSRPGRPNLVLLAPAGGLATTGATHPVIPDASPPALVPPGEARFALVAGGRPDDQRLRQARRRRRDLVLALVATAVFTGLLGLVPSLHALWVVTGLSGLAIAAYVGLAAYALLLEADRRVLSAPIRPRFEAEPDYERVAVGR